MTSETAEDVVIIEDPNTQKSDQKSIKTKFREIFVKCVKWNNHKNQALAASAVLAVVVMGILICLITSRKENNQGRVVKFCDGRPCDGSEVWPGSNDEPVTQRTTTTAEPTTIESTTTTTGPINNNTSTEVPIEPCIYPSCGAPHATYYFPRIINREVTYARARALCTPLQNYEYDLSGIDQMNKWFLTNTAKIVSGVNTFGVWIGGHFDLSSDTPYIVRWSDKSRSDALKSPDEIWCAGKHPKYVLPRLIQLRGKRGIVPIVRLRIQSDCLTTFEGDVSSAVHYPLCVTTPVQIFLKLDDKIMIPPFYERVFNKEHLSFINLNQLYATLPADVRDSTLALINSRTNVPYMYVGFKELVPHGYAKALCRLVSYRAGGPKGSLITDAIISQHASFYGPDIWKQMSRLEPFGVSVALASAGLIDFEEDERQTSYDDGDDRWNGYINQFQFLPCFTDQDVELRKRYVEFIDWYKSSGYMTTGPYHVKLAIQAKGRHPDYPCYRIEAGDLYWPGTKLWVPLCQSAIE